MMWDRRKERKQIDRCIIHIIFVGLFVLHACFLDFVASFPLILPTHNDIDKERETRYVFGHGLHIHGFGCV